MQELDFIEKYIKLISKEMDKELIIHDPKELYEPITYILKIGGKRLRPILVLLSAELFSLNPKIILSKAIAVELFHNFTLIHDDIMDNAPIRRNQVTIHNKWNLNTAILSGDAVLIKAYSSLISDNLDYSKSVIESFNETALKVCEGQQLDMNFESEDKISLEKYIEMIKLKTAVLIGFCFKVSAIISGTSLSNQNAIYNFGLFMGICFQLKDDILDLFGDEKFGKKIGGDIISNKKTCLYIMAEKYSNLEQKKILYHIYSNSNMSNEEKINKVKILYKKVKVEENCNKLVQKYYDKALIELNKVSIDNSRKLKARLFFDQIINRKI